MTRVRASENDLIQIRRAIQQLNQQVRSLSKRVDPSKLVEYADTGDGVTTEWNLGEVYQAGTTILIVEGYRYRLKTTATTALDIWEYEESTGYETITTRNPIPQDTPFIVLFAGELEV